MSAPLHIETTGQGQPLVMLHGWGLHGGVFDTVAPALAERFEVIRVDLPGFGRSAYAGARLSLDSMAQQVIAAVPAEAVWLGWSMGGLVALRAALRATAINKLILVASTPRFITAHDWPHAIDTGVLESFSRELKADYRATLQRFLALQCRGSARARDELRSLQASVFEHGEPDPRALDDGLSLLRETDLRPLLSALQLPVCFIQGERDTLIPIAAVESAAQAIPDARVVSIAGAGHAPFISHPDSFVNEVEQFIHE